MSVWMRHEYWPSNGWSDKRQKLRLSLFPMDRVDFNVIKNPAKDVGFLSGTDLYFQVNL